MSAHNDGGPAFPVPEVRSVHGDLIQWNDAGMSLRDYFAAKAMESFASPTVPLEITARDCYAMADAMLKAREVAP